MGACQSSTNGHHHHKPGLDLHNNDKSTKSDPNRESISKGLLTPPIDKISPFTKYDEVSKYYKLGVHRGSGSFGIVREAVEHTSGLKFAVKTVWKAQFADKKQFILQEIEILLKVEHENIVKCYQVYEDHNCVHFVFELVEGGDLFDYLISSPNHIIPETRAADFFNQILDALQYLHERGIVHRDIKPENFLIYQNGSQVKIKLIDFGFAAILKEHQKLNDKVGSLQYIAPEMLKDEDYDFKVDMWASGIVLFNMLTGKQPFFGKIDSELINSILTHDVNFSDNYFKNTHAKNLCANLLNKNPIERFSANDAKSSMWIQNYININVLPTVVGVKFQPKEENIKNILNLLNQQSNVKTEVWNLLLTYLNIETMGLLKQKLAEIKEQMIVGEGIVDQSIGGKDTVSYELMLTTIVTNYNVDVELKNKISDLLESRKEICQKQVVNFKDFLEKLIKSKIIFKKERIWNIFKSLDKNGVGYLNQDQMCKGFKEYFPKYDPEKMKELLKMSTIDNKNNIKYEEFYKLWEQFGNLNL